MVEAREPGHRRHVPRARRRPPRHPDLGAPARPLASACAAAAEEAAGGPRAAGDLDVLIGYDLRFWRELGALVRQPLHRRLPAPAARPVLGVRGAASAPVTDLRGRLWSGHTELVDALTGATPSDRLVRSLADVQRALRRPDRAAGGRIERVRTTAMTPAPGPRHRPAAPADAAVDLSVVVPAYNEEERLRPHPGRDHAAISRGAGPLGRLGGRWSSTTAPPTPPRDRHAAAADDPRVQLVTSPRNRGKGHALRLGVLASRGRRVLVTDADLAAPDRGAGAARQGRSPTGHAAAIGSRAAPRRDASRRHQHRLRELLGRAGNLPHTRASPCPASATPSAASSCSTATGRAPPSPPPGSTAGASTSRYCATSGARAGRSPRSRCAGRTRRARRSGPLDYVRVLLRARPAAAPVPYAAADLAVVGLFLLAVGTPLQRAAGPTSDRRYLADSLQDQNQWEWFFAVTADNVAHLRNPLFTDLQGYPDGVNLMANTVMLGLSVPLAPVTLLFGPGRHLGAGAHARASPATATAWYWLIAAPARTAPVGRRRSAARFAAFAPPMVRHANAHPNFLVLFMIPVIIDRALRLCEGARCRTRRGAARPVGGVPDLPRRGAAAARGDGHAAVRRSPTRSCAGTWRGRPGGRCCAGSPIAAAVCLPLVAFPLGWQFFGPQSYTSVLHGDNAGNSPLACSAVRGALAHRARDEARTRSPSTAPSRTPSTAGRWSRSRSAIVVRLWRLALVKALAFTAVAAAFLSLGPEVPRPATRTSC